MFDADGKDVFAVGRGVDGGAVPNAAGAGAGAGSKRVLPLPATPRAVVVKVGGKGDVRTGGRGGDVESDRLRPGGTGKDRASGRGCEESDLEAWSGSEARCRAEQTESAIEACCVLGMLGVAVVGMVVFTIWEVKKS